MSAYHCATCGSDGFQASVLGAGCAFCDGTEGGQGPVVQARELISKARRELGRYPEAGGTPFSEGELTDLLLDNMPALRGAKQAKSLLAELCEPGPYDEHYDGSSHEGGKQ